MGTEAVTGVQSLAALMAARAELYAGLHQVNEGMVLELIESQVKRGQRSLDWSVRSDHAERFTELLTGAGFEVALGEPREDAEEQGGRLWCQGTVRW